MDITARLITVLSSAIDRPLTLDEVKDANLIETLGLSSVDALEVLIRIEGEFGIQIHDEDLSIDLVSSFGALERYVQGRIAAAA